MDIAADGRWPRYRREALQQTPIRSVLSFQLFTAKQVSAALNCCAEQDHAFDEDSVQLGLAFAAHMALVWSTFRREDLVIAAVAAGGVKQILLVEAIPNLVRGGRLDHGLRDARRMSA